MAVKDGDIMGESGAMAPIEVIDYIIILELCHLTHINHSSYWRLVGSIIPDYKENEEFLARHGQARTL